MISVIVPVHNAERYLEEALRSVLAQGYRPLDLVVVDDGSRDGSAQVARSFPEVRLFRQENAGPAAARNRGLREAQGDLIAFIDADDLWTAGRLAWQLELLKQRPELELVGGAVRIFGEAQPPSEPITTFTFGSCLHRRGVFDTVGLLDESLRFGEDTDWIARAREAGVPMHFDGRVALEYRRHTHNLTADKATVQRHLTLVLKRSLDRRRRG